MSSLVIQDHYSVRSDNQHPTFILQKAERSSENVWGHQMDQLFVFKMSEIMRVLFTMRLLQTGPEVEKGFTYSDVSGNIVQLPLNKPLWWPPNPLTVHTSLIVAPPQPPSLYAPPLATLTVAPL